MLSRKEFERVIAELTGLSFASSMILVGSSALYRLSSRVSPMTEDVDVALPEALLVRDSKVVRGELTSCGFTQVESTATWVDRRGASVDLLTFDRDESSDRAGGAPGLPAMLFASLNRILTDPEGRGVVAGAPGHLSAVGLVLSKLTTLRLEKGVKDRLHALLLIAEHSPRPGFRDDFVALGGRFGAEEREDMVPDAQMALLSLQDRGAGQPDWAREYVHSLEEIRSGFLLLEEMTHAWR